MTNQEEPKPLKALSIVGANTSISDDIKDMFNGRDDCLIIGDVGDDSFPVTVEYIRSILAQKNLKITENTRIDIETHGNRRKDNKHEMQINSTDPKGVSLTEQLFQELREMAGCPLYVHLWSCYGGSANKAASSLGNDSILVTHIEGKLLTNRELSSYSRTFSLQRYLEKGLTPSQQFILDFPENFETATFNKVGMDDKIEKFKFTRMHTSKEKEMADILKNISSENNLTDHFNGFFAKEAERFKEKFKAEFQDADAANAITSVSELNEQTAKTFATGVLMHLCAITADDELDSFKELLEKLLQKGININDHIYDMTFLYIACVQGKINMIEMLLNNGADIKAPDKYGYTPLHFACTQDHTGVIAMLLAKGAETKVQNKNGHTPLHFACYKGDSDAVGILLKNKAEINAKSNDGSTPLHLACLKGHIEVIKELLKIPIIVDSLTMKNNKGEISLELIAEDNKEAIALLTEAEKSMHSKDKNLALDNAEEINDLSVNQQMSKDNSEQLSNNELQNDLKLTELLLVGHTEDTSSDCYGA
ncbi:MAG: ankyrin repeat domain-containing protein [Rickettsia endosymbiont of Labidopullus appendiculatus]|nr:ankyrin repeat domain-containing protein [Rickettsia endosymbiont of Labidopullus appendiculatus]